MRRNTADTIVVLRARAGRAAVGLAIVLTLLLLQSVTGTPAIWAAREAAPSCTVRTSGKSACRVMPAGGSFQLPIPGTPAVLVGAGAPDRAGKPIVIERVSLVCPSLGGFGIHITTPKSAGLLPPLHWTNGTLYSRNPSTGQCSGISSPALAAAPGTYQVVPGNGITRMPATGGGAILSDRPLPLLPDLILLFLGAGLLAATRVTPSPRR